MSSPRSLNWAGGYLLWPLFISFSVVVNSLRFCFSIPKIGRLIYCISKNRALIISIISSLLEGFKSNKWSVLFREETIIVFLVNVDSKFLGVGLGHGFWDPPDLVDSYESLDFELLDIVDLFRCDHKNSGLSPVEHVNLLNVIAEQQSFYRQVFVSKDASLDNIRTWSEEL